MLDCVSRSRRAVGILKIVLETDVLGGPGLDMDFGPSDLSIRLALSPLLLFGHCPHPSFNINFAEDDEIEGIVLADGFPLSIEPSCY